jgi:hypothetical protein
MKINVKAVDKKWFELEGTGASFLIRPFPLSLTKWDENKVIELLYEQFDYCLMDWKGVTDEEDKELKCNPKNKKIVFDFSEKVREFVYSTSKALSEEIVEEVKN